MKPLRKFLGFLSDRRLAINEAVAEACSTVADRCFAYALATNIAPMPREGEWLPMPEYGDVDYWTVEDGNPKKYVQRFTPELATKMRQRLQAVHMKEGQDFRGLPIFKGHPPADPSRWSDETRLGNVLEIDPDPQRARVKVALNDLGRKNQQEGYWVYPSPGWNYSEQEAKRTGFILPDELHHIGMTNMPRMASAKPWTNVDEGGSQFAANNPISPAGGATKPNEKEPMYKKQLLKLLNLDEKATDEQIEAACNKSTAVNSEPMEVALGDKKIKVVIAGDNRDAFLQEVGALATNSATAANELKAAQTSASNAAEEAKKFKKLAINTALDRGIDKGLITAAERPQWATKFEADFAAAETELSARKTALNNKPLDPLQPNGGPDFSTAAGRQLAFNVRVDAIQDEARKSGRAISLNDAIRQMRANPADAALLKAMEVPAT